MKVAVDLKAMTLPEKLGLLQAVWDDLVQAESEIESPTWHEDVLRNREEQVRSGREQPLDWKTAKAQLQRELK